MVTARLLLITFLISLAEAAKLRTTTILSVTPEDLVTNRLYKITIDLRHIYDYDGAFNYLIDWNLILVYFDGTAYRNMTLDNNFPEPAGFHLSKEAAFHFYFFPIVTGAVYIQVRHENELWAFQQIAFIDCASIEPIISPYENQSNAGEFLAVIPANSAFEFPTNLLWWQNRTHTNASFIVSSVLEGHENRTTSTLGQITQERARSLLFKAEDQPYAALPYLPYFSECSGFGRYIFLQAISQNKAYCQFFSPEETKVVGNFEFGAEPESDKCEVETECAFPVDINSIDVNDARHFFLANLNSDLFYFNPYAFNGTSRQFEILGDKNTFDNLIAVRVMNTQIKDMIPLAATLTISYRQMSLTERKIVYSTVNFYNWVRPRVGIRTYKLNIVFEPWGHTMLTVYSCMDLYYYVFLIIVAAILCATMPIPWLFFHRVTSRAKDFSFTIWRYAKTAVSPMVQGLLLTTLIFTVYSAIISIIFLQKIMNFQLNASTYSEESGSTSHSIIWDSLIPGEVSAQERPNWRIMRFGLLLVHAGCVILAKMMVVLVPTIENDVVAEMRQMPDKNVYNFDQIRRNNFLFFCIFYVFYELARIHLAFSVFLEKNVYFFPGIFKIISAAAKYSFGFWLKDKVQIAIFDSGSSAFEYIICAGSRDFLEFFLAALVNLNVIVMDRAYADEVIEDLLVYLGELLFRFSAFIKAELGAANWSGGYIRSVEEEEEREASVRREQSKNTLGSEQGGTELTEGSQGTAGDSTSRRNQSRDKNETQNSEGSDDDSVAKMIKEDDSSVSEILLEDDLIQEKLTLRIKRDIYNMPSWKSDAELQDLAKHGMLGPRPTAAQIFETELQDEPRPDPIEALYKRTFAKPAEGKRHFGRTRSSASMSEEMEEEEEALERYFDYSCKSVLLVLSPYLFWMIWAFYPEIGMARNFRITYNAFAYYFLFSIIYIPAQLFADILCYHQLHLHTKLNLLEAMEGWQRRFENRDRFWSFPVRSRTGLPLIQRTMYNLCYNWQYYFIVSMVLMAIAFVVIGIMTMINSTVSPFRDPFLFVFVTLNHLILELLGGLLGLINRYCERQFNQRRDFQRRSASSPSEPRFTKIRFTEKSGLGSEPLVVQRDSMQIPNVSSILQRHRNAQAEQRILDRLRKTTFVDPKFQEEFLTRNSVYLRENLKNLLTADAVARNKYVLMKSLGKIVESLNIVVPPKNEAPRMPEVSPRYRKFASAQPPRTPNPFESNEPQESTNLRGLLEDWRVRAEKINVAKMDVARLLEKMTATKCQVCGDVWGLRCELVDNIERLFDAFLAENRTTIHSYYSYAWQLYFEKHAIVRTLCRQCADQILGQ